MTCRCIVIAAAFAAAFAAAILALPRHQHFIVPATATVACTPQLELERKLRALLTKEKERAEEEAALAVGLCTGGAMLP
jgi:hypothetical protein